MTIHGNGQPNGMLVAVGGNEDKEFDLKVLRRICGLPHGGTERVEIVPTASSEPKETSEQYLKAFAKIGIPHVNVMDIESREEAKDPAFVARIREADVVYFTGGDQLRITSLLGGSPVHAAILTHYMNGGVVAGTSAGAAAMSSTMIFEGDAANAMKKGNVQMTPGLGLVHAAVIDTHFIARGRFSRLLEVVTSNPGYLGLGVGEDTGIIIRAGHLVEAIGQGVVVVVDGHHMGYSNISDASMGEPIAAESVTVHTLVNGHGFDLLTQQYLPPSRLREGDP